MIVLMLSRGFAALKDGSEPAERMRSYGELVSRLIIVLCERGGTGEKKNLASNVEVWTVPAALQPVALFKGWLLARRIARELKKESDEPILITSENPFELGLIGWLLKKEFKLPLQLQIHTDLYSPYFRTENIVNWARYWIAQFLLPRADCIRVVSERVRAPLTSKFSAEGGSTSGGKLLNSKVVALPIFVETEKFRRAQASQDIHERTQHFKASILVASRLTKEKNIELAAEAFRRVIEKLPQTVLLIAGDGPERKNLESRIKNLGLERNVKLLGWRDDLPEIMKAVDIFLLTSNYEGWSRSIIEAMAAGLPVVMTDVGVAGELVKSGINGCVVPVGEAKAIAAAIIRLLDDARERERLTSNARKALLELPIQNKADYLAAYRKMWEACSKKV